MSNYFHRVELLYGEQTLAIFSTLRIIQFGLGGVGSWCLESLVRSGFTKFTLVDYDRICETNINRQLPATSETIGLLKTEVLAKRMKEINPNIEVTIRSEAYNLDTADSFQLNEYDIIIDCIDSMNCKMNLIRQATKTKAFFISSMGAALKVDASKIAVSSFWDVQYDLFARRLRKNIRKGELPAKDFPCVYSTEPAIETGYTIEKNENGEHKRINGSTAHVTAIFGFTIASEICRHFSESI